MPMYLLTNVAAAEIIE